MTRTDGQNEDEKAFYSEGRIEGEDWGEEGGQGRRRGASGIMRPNSANPNNANNVGIPSSYEEHNFSAKLLPLKAVWYFLTHGSLWGLACSFFCLQVVIFIAISIVTWGSFGAQLTGFETIFKNSEWEAVLATIFAVLAENVTLFCIIVYAVLLPCIQDRLYCKVFELENVPWCPVDSKTKCCIDCSRGCTISLIFLTVLLLCLPLTLIPVIGVFCWAAANAFFVSWNILDRYFGHKCIPFAQAWSFAKSHSADLFVFGFITMLLSSIPILQLILMYTNLVAGALWACHLERYHVLSSYSVLGHDQEDPYSVELNNLSSSTNEYDSN